MKEPKNNNDELVEKLLEHLSLDEPTSNFSNKILAQLNDNSTFVYKPLISSKVWVASILGILCIVFILWKNSILNVGEFSLFNTDIKLNFESISFNLPNYSLSNLVMFSVLFFFLILIFQVYSILRMHSKSLQW